MKRQSDRCLACPNVTVSAIISWVAIVTPVAVALIAFVPRIAVVAPTAIVAPISVGIIATVPVGGV